MSETRPETLGDSEADFLMRIALAIKGTDIGMKTMGQNEDGSFSFVVMEPNGVVVAFTHQSPVTVADRFVQYAETRTVW